MSDEHEPLSTGESEALERLLERAEGLRRERRELQKEIEDKRSDLGILQMQAEQAEEAAKIALGKPSRVLLSLCVLGLAGYLGYLALPATVDLHLKAWEGKGSAEEARRLMMMVGLRPVRVNDSSGPISILLKSNLGGNKRLKLKYFLDALVSTKPPATPPKLFLRGSGRQLVLDRDRGAVTFLATSSNQKLCVWAIPARLTPPDGERGVPVPVTADLSRGAVRASDPWLQPVADRIIFDKGIIYLQRKTYEHLFLMNDTMKDRCAWAILMGADKRVLSHLLFPVLSRKLLTYKLGKGLF